MRKFIFFFMVIVVLGALGFFFGWAQFSVPQGAFGVVRSKTHGIDPRLVREGEFRWIWYKLIPTNVEILTFAPKTVSNTLKSSGELPSGTVYAEIAGINADFSWEISADYSFSIKPDALPALVRDENINSGDDLRVLEGSFTRRVENFIITRINRTSEDDAQLESMLAAGAGEIIGEIEKAFPELDKVNCVIRTARFPDYALYRSVRGLYDEYLARQKEFLRGAVTRNAESNIRTRTNLDELEKYGEILTRYPVLLEFLALERELAREMLNGE